MFSNRKVLLMVVVVGTATAAAVESGLTISAASALAKTALNAALATMASMVWFVTIFTVCGAFIGSYFAWAIINFMNRQESRLTAVENQQAQPFIINMGEWNDNALKDFFTCPITLDIIEDPVLLPDHRLYERIAIQRWFQTNPRSPYNNMVIPNPNSLPTHEACLTFLRENRDRLLRIVPK